MSMQILGPEGPHPVENGTYRYIVRTRVPKDRFEVAMLENRFRNAEVHAGDTILVQCLSHQYDELLHSGEFVVISRKDARFSEERGAYEVHQGSRPVVKIQQVGDWWASELAPEEAEVDASGYYADDHSWIAEHAGRGKYRVKDAAGNTVASGLEKAEAEAIARGDMAVPEAA